jgi:hypothetical protein
MRRRASVTVARPMRGLGSVAAVWGAAEAIIGSGTNLFVGVVLRAVALALRALLLAPVVPIPNGKAGEGRTRLEITQALSGQNANTAYHYRLTATNITGTTNGEDKTFTTMKWCNGPSHGDPVSKAPPH